MRAIVGVKGHLLDLPAISSIVSTRVFELILPQKPTMPSIVLTLISDPSLGDHMRGVGGMFVSRVQVDCWAKTPDTAAALGILVRRRMDGFTGVWSMAGSPEDALTVSLIECEDSRDFFEKDIEGGLCRHSADFLVTARSADETMLAFDSL